MTYHTSSANLRNRSAFVATVLAYVLLTSQLAPIAKAFNRSADRRAAALKPGIERNKPSEARPQGVKASSFAPVPVPLRLTAAGLAPIISATKVDSFPDPDGDGKVSPGQTITYSVTLTNTGPDPALNVTLNDTVDPNTTLVGGSSVSTPIAFDDSYNVIGNVRIQPNAAQGLLANDNNPNTGNNSGLTASGPTTSTQGGDVAINADGSFSYDPPVGFTGTDTFTYTTTSANGTDTATVTLTVAGMIFFVNDDDPTAGGDGRLTNPFNCLVGAGCFTDSTADEAGDNIFLFNGAYTGGLTLLTNQKLIGQGASDTLANIAAVGSVQPYSDPLPVTNGNPANVIITTGLPGTNALTVSAGGITLRGFTVGNTTGAKIFGSAFGTLTAGNNTTPDVVLSGTGQALSLSSGTFAATSAFNSVTTTSSVGQGILLSGVAGTVSFGSTTVSGSTTQGILVSTTTANINFGNTLVSGGTDGISLQNNSGGTRTFGSLSISNNNSAGFLHSVGGGATTVTGATIITNPTGVGIDVDGSNANLSFAATTVDKGMTSGIGVDLTNNATRTIGFTSLTVTTTNAFALNTNNSGTVNAGGGSLTQSGAGGGAASLTNTTLGLTFTSISSNNGGNGIIISGGSGTLASGVTNLQNNAGIGLLMSSSAVAANFGNTTVNSSAGDGVDLSSNTGSITFADLDITPDANLRGLDASNNIGTITSTSGDITTTGAPALNIAGANAAARTPLSMTLDNVVSTNSTTLGVAMNFVSGNLTVTGAGTDTDIQNPTGIGIQVLNSGAGTLNFGDTVVNGSGGTGVVLGTASNGNTGALTFADLDISPDSGQRALHAIQNTGAVTIASGTITTTNQTAVEIVGTSSASRTPLNTQLTTVSTTGGAVAANGIRLVNTSATGSPGGFRVLGTGGTCNAATPTCTGGRITNTSGADNSGAAPAGTGVSLDNAATVLLTSMRIDNHTNYGIRGTLVSAFTLSNSLVDGTNGTNQNGPFNEGSINFAELTGTSLITTSEISGGFGRNVGIDNTTGTLGLTVSNCNIHNTGNAAGDDGLFIELGDPAVTPSAVGTLHVTNNTFSAHGGDHFDLSLFGSPTASLVFTGNAGSPGSPVHPIGLGQNFRILGANFNGTFTYDVSTNTVNGSKQGHAIMVNKGSGTGTFSGRISGNTIGLSGVVLSGASQSNGISVESRGGGSHTTLVTNNTIRQYRDIGINIEGAEAGTTTLNATVTGNTIEEPGSPGAAGLSLHGIQLNWGIDVGNTSVACVDIGGSTPALRNNAPNSGNEAAGGADIRPRQRQSTTVRLPGYSGANSDNAAVATYLSGRNTVTSVVASNTVPTGGGFLNSSPANSPCTQPTIPTAPQTVAKESAESEDMGSPGATVAESTATSTPDSITSRPFISSPRSQTVVAPVKPAVQPSAANPVVVDRGLRYIPKPKPAVPPSGDGNPTPPVIVGDTLTWNVGTLPAGSSVTITFQVVVDDPFTGIMQQVSNQGTVTADGGISVLTDDPSVGGSNDPTVTGVTVPPDLFVRDARVAEPTSGSTSMLFTLALSTPAPMSGITVNLSTADDTAIGGDCASGNDYTTVSGGTVTFASGEQIKTFPVTVCSDVNAEGDETFFLSVNSAPGAVIVDGQGVGTITAANAPGTIMISELRTSGPAGAGDDFVEIYNNTDSPHTVPAGGYGLFKMGADCNAVPVLIGTIPATTVIPQRGHFLFVGSTYSLANYGGTGAAAGDQVLTADIENDFNIGLFSTVDLLSISTATRLDAVGFGTNSGGVCDVLLEGTTLPPASGSTLEHSFVREFTLLSNDVPTPTDGNDNAADFTLVSTTLSTPVGSNTPRLGAPGPENLAGPNVKKFSQVGAQLIDPMVPQASAPNRFRDATPDPVNNSTFGTLASRRKFINNTGSAITRLRFRIYDITTAPSPPGTADLRALTSGNVTVTVTGGSMVTVLGTSVETPPAQPNSGGLNSTFSAGTVTLVTPLANGDSINLQFLFGVQQTGSFRVFVFVEALP